MPNNKFVYTSIANPEKDTCQGSPAVEVTCDEVVKTSGDAHVRQNENQVKVKRTYTSLIGRQFELD